MRPAAPTPDDEGPEPCPLHVGQDNGCTEPAEPEPSADPQIVQYDGRAWVRLGVYQRAEAQLAAVNERIRKALVYLTDKDDVESTPLHAIGHAVQELRGG